MLHIKNHCCLQVVCSNNSSIKWKLLVIQPRGHWWSLRVEENRFPYIIMRVTTEKNQYLFYDVKMFSIQSAWLRNLFPIQKVVYFTRNRLNWIQYQFSLKRRFYFHGKQSGGWLKAGLKGCFLKTIESYFNVDFIWLVQGKFQGSHLALPCLDWPTFFCLQPYHSHDFPRIDYIDRWTGK